MGPDAIAAELGTSRATAARRMRALKPGVGAVRRASRAAAAPAPVAKKAAPLPEPDEEIAESTSLEQIGEWLRMAKDEAEAARSAGDVDNLGKMLRIASTLLALQQKHTPVAPPDPNDNPDFIAAAERAKKRWLDLLDRIPE
jgi:hypothetical protein